MATTEKPTAVHRAAPRSARRTPSSSPAAPATSMTSRSPGCSGPTSCAAPSPTRRSTAWTSRRRVAMEGCVAAFSGADLAERVGRAARLRVAGHRRHQDERALAARQGQGPPRRRRRRRRRRDEPRVLAKDAAELVEVDWEPLPAVTDPLAAMEDGAPLVHDDFGTNVSSVWGFEKGDSPAPHKTSKPFFDDPDLVKVKHALPAAATDPERHRAALRAGGPEPGDGRVHDVHGEPDPAHRAHDAGHHLRHRRGQAARGRPRRRRRLRLEARHLRRGVDLPRAGPASERGRSSGRRSAPRATSPRSTGATSTPTWRWPRRATAS